MLLAWLVIVFIAPSGYGARGHAIVAAIRNQAHQNDGKQFSREELTIVMSKMKLDYSLIRYIPRVNYTSSSDWHVTLAPEKRKAFVNLHS